MQAFESHGLWSLPDSEAPPVAGTLRVSSSGELRLSLIGSLGAVEPQQTKEHPVILGEVDGPLGNSVTLVGCRLTGSKFGSVPGVWEEYRAQRGFFGAYLSKPSDFAFRRMQIQVGGLGAWACSLSGLRPGELGGTRVGQEAPLLYYATPMPVGGLVAGGEISLGFGLTMRGPFLGDASFSEQPYLVVTCDLPLSEKEINQRFIYPLQNLMTFVCDRAQEVEQVSVWREDILAPMGDNPEIRLIGKRVFPEEEDEKSEPILPYKLLFSLADLEEGFAPFVERWLHLTTKYAEACNIFFGFQYGPPPYLDIEFLGLVESLCLYYTRREDGVAHRNQEDRRLTEILGKLSSADAEWIQGHIWSRPFPPIQDILAKLLREQSEVMSKLLRTGEAGLITEVMNTVDYTLRRDPELGPTASHGAELYWLTVKLRILLKLCFLQELGFSIEKIRSFFAKNGVFQHLSHLVSTQREEPTH